MIAALLKYAREQPASVIAGLLAIIVASGIAGGLWIQSLRSAIDERDRLIAERDKIIAERFALVQVRYENELSILKRANILLREQASIIERSNIDIPAGLQTLASVVKELRAKGALTVETATALEAAIGNATQDAQSLARALERGKDIDRLIDTQPPGTPAEGPPPLHRAYYYTSNPLPMIIIAAALALLVLAGFIGLRRALRASSVRAAGETLRRFLTKRRGEMFCPSCLVTELGTALRHLDRVLIAPDHYGVGRQEGRCSACGSDRQLVFGLAH